jgi:hypothetical protein
MFVLIQPVIILQNKMFVLIHPICLLFFVTLRRHVLGLACTHVTGSSTVLVLFFRKWLKLDQMHRVMLI